MGIVNSLLPARRPLLVLMCLACVGLLSFGMYLQHVVGLEPCPMCIVQRYVMVLIVLVCALGAAINRPGSLAAGLSATVLLGLAGAFVAARQSWLQWFPPEIQTCGRDFYGMIETFPLKRALPMIFQGSGDCSQIDWTFLGGSIANWSFVAFCGLTFISLACLLRPRRRTFG